MLQRAYQAAEEEIALVKRSGSTYKCALSPSIVLLLTPLDHKIAHLALKHHISKNHKTRIIAFVGSPITANEKELIKMANAEENPQVSSNAGVVSGSVVCLIASVAAFWYFSMSASEVKKDLVHQDSKIRLFSEKEFLDQPRIETENALKELREH